MRSERGHIVLNALLVILVVAAALIFVVPNFFGDDISTQDKAAQDQLASYYQEWRVRAAAQPPLLHASAQELATLFGKVNRLDPVGVQKGTAAPAAEDKVFLTTLTGKHSHFQAVVLSASGNTCVLTAHAYETPTVQC